MPVGNYDGDESTRGVQNMFTKYTDFAIGLGIDVVAIFLLSYVLYFRRHRRADLLLSYVALNIGIFVAMSLLTAVRLDVALGFGLFAILSIIRLRSTSVTQQEVAYYFVALVMGLANGLDIGDRLLVVLVNLLLLATMFAVDSRPLRDRARRLDVTLDVVHHDRPRVEAERHLGLRRLQVRCLGALLHPARLDPPWPTTANSPGSSLSPATTCARRWRPYTASRPRSSGAAASSLPRIATSR